MPTDPLALYYASAVRQQIAQVYVGHNPTLGYKAVAAAMREIALHVESAHSTRDAVNMLARVEDSLMRALPADGVVVVDGVIGLKPPAPAAALKTGAQAASEVRQAMSRQAVANWRQAFAGREAFFFYGMLVVVLFTAMVL